MTQIFGRPLVRKAARFSPLISFFNVQGENKEEFAEILTHENENQIARKFSSLTMEWKPLILQVKSKT